MLSESDYAAFLRAVRADPGDDLPRLVMADWLDENGCPERAALIRHGIACPQTVFADNVPHRLTDRGARFEGRWSVCPGKATARGATKVINSALPPPTTRRRMDAEFRRGFLDMLKAPWEWVRDRLGAVLRREPVRRVVLTTEPAWDGEYSDGVLSAVLVGCDGDGVVLLQHTPPGDVVLALLRAEWPEVAEWELPHPERWRGELMARAVDQLVRDGYAIVTTEDDA